MHNNKLNYTQYPKNEQLQGYRIQIRDI